MRGIYLRGTLYVENPSDFCEKNQWEVRFGKFAEARLLPLSELTVPSILEQNYNWILARNDEGKPVGIKTWVACNPMVIDGNLESVMQYFDDGFYISDENLNVTRQYELTRALTESEIKFAKAKFIELLQQEQNSLLEQRDAVRFMKESEENYD